MMRGFYTPECNLLYATARPSPGTAVAAHGTALATASDLERSQRVGGQAKSVAVVWAHLGASVKEVEGESSRVLRIGAA